MYMYTVYIIYTHVHRWSGLKREWKRKRVFPLHNRGRVANATLHLVRRNLLGVLLSIDTVD